MDKTHDYVRRHRDPSEIFQWMEEAYFAVLLVVVLLILAGIVWDVAFNILPGQQKSHSQSDTESHMSIFPLSNPNTTEKIAPMRTADHGAFVFKLHVSNRSYAIHELRTWPMCQGDGITPKLGL